MPRSGATFDENVPPWTRGDFRGVTGRPPPALPYAPLARRGVIFKGDPGSSEIRGVAVHLGPRENTHNYRKSCVNRDYQSAAVNSAPS